MSIPKTWRYRNPDFFVIAYRECEFSQTLSNDLASKRDKINQKVINGYQKQNQK